MKKKRFFVSVIAILLIIVMVGASSFKSSRLPEQTVLPSSVISYLQPVHRKRNLTDLVDAIARGKAPAHHRAHARAGHDVKGNAQLLEGLENADVRKAPGAAPGEHQPEPRALGVLPRKLLC